MNLEQAALQRARRWAVEVAPAESRCIKQCDTNEMMRMFWCFGPKCKAHCHHYGLGGWIMRTWSSTGSDRYFCSRQCYLNRIIDHLGEKEAARYIRRHWFRTNEITEAYDDLEQLAEELLERLWELQELIDDIT